MDTIKPVIDAMRAKAAEEAARQCEAMTGAIERLAGAQGLTVEEVERRAGLKPGFLRPVVASKMRVNHIEAVAKALGLRNSVPLWAD